MTDLDALHAKLHHTVEEASQLYNVAGAYAEDGALATAADRLRRAADKLDQAHELRQRVIAGCVNEEHAPAALGA